MTFKCILRWVLGLDGCEGGSFLDYCSVRHENGVNIVAVGSTSFSNLGIGEDGVVNGLINVRSSLIFS